MWAQESHKLGRIAGLTHWAFAVQGSHDLPLSTVESSKNLGLFRPSGDGGLSDGPEPHTIGLSWALSIPVGREATAALPPLPSRQSQLTSYFIAFVLPG